MAKRKVHRNAPRFVPPEEVVRELVRRINRHDSERLTQLLGEKHVCIDSLGHRLEGDRRMMQAAWDGYFQMVPDYRIDVQAIVGRGNTVLMVGTASGKYRSSGGTEPVGTWHTPAAWRAVVRRGHVAEWQVYADNEPIRELMRRVAAENNRPRATEEV